MDFNTFGIVYRVLAGISYMTAIIVGVVGWHCLTPEEMLRKVFPYIKKSGNHNVVFGFIITKRSIRYHYFYLINLVALIIFEILINAVIITSYKYNPYDNLDCFISYNGSIIKLESEEQAKMDNVTHTLCYGWNFDIGGGIGHTVALLTLSWIFSSIVLWVKLKWWYKATICIKEGEKFIGYCSYVTLFLFQVFLLLCSIAALYSALILLRFNLHVPLKVYADVALVCTVLVSGLLVFPAQKKSKSLADHCKEAVENKQGEEERALEEIRNRLTERVQDPHQVNLLLELAELECKKALEENETVSEDEMKTIAQVAYHKVTTNDGGDQYNNDQQYNTRQGASINGPTERDGLLGGTRRNNNNYSYFN